MAERYKTDNIKKAFLFLNEKNKVEKKNVWRVGCRIQNKIIFDIDNSSIENIRSIKEYYENILNVKFAAFRTNGGYHLFSEKYTDSTQCQYDQCRVLYPSLKTNQIQKYVENVEKWYHEAVKKYENGKLKNQGVTEFKNSILCNFPEKFDFDILFSIKVLIRGYYVVRISKKGENDNPIEIIL